jgi:site-specific recombinase XerD
MMGAKRRYHFKDIAPADPAVKRFGAWLPENRSFYGGYRRWLHETGCGASTLNLYGVAARQALGLLDKPYWSIDPEADLERVRQHLDTRPLSAGSRDGYRKGLKKLADYLRLRCHRPAPPKTVHWDYFLGALPRELTQAVRDYLAHGRRAWTPDRQDERTADTLSHLTIFLRWAAAHAPLRAAADLTPELWFAYLDERLATGIQPRTLNGQLLALQQFLQFLADRGDPVCQRTLRLDLLDKGHCLPHDVPIDLLRRLLAAIEAEAASPHRGRRRTGLMDRAWFLLMLHSGLRTAEVRHLRRADLELARQQARIEQSKGLKDRVVCLSPAVVQALRDYLAVRGPAEALPDHVFIYRHAPLSRSYCCERLRTYGARCGVRVTPHQLRHSCATLLLNAGAPILTVQTLLGHKHIDTTLGYARLYDGTVAADYFQGMAQVERYFALPEDDAAPPPDPAQLLALVDSLREGTLNPAQVETVRALRAGILGLTNP